MQWLHLFAAVMGVGGIAFLAVILLPAVRIFDQEQRELILKVVTRRFRWITWSVVLLLIASGLYNVRQYYWEVPWGRAWKLLAAKIALSGMVFAIVLSLTLPFKIFDWFRARRAQWLAAALTLALIVIFLSAYLRRT